MTRSIVAKVRWVTATSDAKSIRASLSFQTVRLPLRVSATGLPCRNDGGDLRENGAGEVYNSGVGGSIGSRWRGVHGNICQARESRSRAGGRAPNLRPAVSQSKKHRE